MIPTLGAFSLLFILPLSLALMALPLFRRVPVAVQAKRAEWLAHGVMLFALTAFGSLLYSHIFSDFSVANVYRYSHTLKPMLYKVTGTWGNHEGSMLLWLLVIAGYSAAYAAFSRMEAAYKLYALASQGFLLAGIAAFIVFTSNPFLRIFPAPGDGEGLNPLLQDIGLALHPPLLYGGYVGFCLAFSLAVAALIKGEAGREWALAARPWVLAAWSLLTAGIALGSWWAYRELGWGGFWFWDPVENASLLPWLSGTALLHSLLVMIARDCLKRWTLLLAIITFACSLLGTFLVRSGVLTSVHAFANDAARGVFILLFLCIAIGSALTLYACRAHRLTPGTAPAPFFSRENLLTLNNLLFIVATATVLLGTIYPLLLEAWNGSRVAVGAPYFNTTFLPLAVALLILAAIAPALQWKQNRWQTIARANLWPVIAALLAMAVTEWQAGVGVGVWLIAAMLQLAIQRRSSLRPAFLGMILAHVGAGLAAIAISLLSHGQRDTPALMSVGETAELHGYTFRLQQVREVAKDNYVALRGEFSVEKAGSELAILHPEIRLYPVEGSQTTESAIYTTSGLSDLYIALGERNPEGKIAVRLHYRPAVNFLWLAAGLMTVGAGVVLVGILLKFFRRTGRISDA